MIKLAVLVVLCHGLFGVRAKLECPPGCSGPNFIGGLVPPPRPPGVGNGMPPAGTMGPHSPLVPNVPLVPQGSQDTSNIVIGVLSGVIILLVIVIVILIRNRKDQSQSQQEETPNATEAGYPRTSRLINYVYNNRA